MVERCVEHHAHARRVRRRDEIGEVFLGQAARAVGVIRVGRRKRAWIVGVRIGRGGKAFTHEWHDLEEILHRVGAAYGVRRRRVRRILPSVDAVGMDRLEPEPVAAEVLEVGEIPAFAAVGKVGESAPLAGLVARGVHIERVEFVKLDSPRLRGRNDDGMVAPAICGVVNPVRAANEFIAGGEAVGAGFMTRSR